MRKWIDVSDNMPPDNEIVLVSYPMYTDKKGEEHFSCVGCAYVLRMGTNTYWCRSDGTTFGELGLAKCHPVAWMPLPMPFDEKGDNAWDIWGNME